MSSNGRKHGASGESQGAAVWWAGFAGVLIVVALVVWLRSGREFPEVSHPEGLHLMRALYTACSSQSEERLSVVERKVTEAAEQGVLTEPELAAFREIIARGQSADWEHAAAKSYQFARDQVR
jgi:hypothetical protein